MVYGIISVMLVLHHLSMFGHSIILLWLAMTSWDFWKTRGSDRLQICFFFVFLSLTLDRLWSVVHTIRAVYFSSDRFPSSHCSILMFVWRNIGHVFAIGAITSLVLQMRKAQKEDLS